MARERKPETITRCNQFIYGWSRCDRAATRQSAKGGKRYCETCFARAMENAQTHLKRSQRDIKLLNNLRPVGTEEKEVR